MEMCLLFLSTLLDARRLWRRESHLEMLCQPRWCALSLMLRVGPAPPRTQPALRWVQSELTAWRKERHVESIGSSGALTPPEQEMLLSFLQENHTAFALEEHEWSETDLMEMDIDTGDAEPQRCSPRRTPFAIRDEVARHLEITGVIQSSTSPWSRLVVMVQKDSTHRFCVDCRRLNAVTKADTHPLPRTTTYWPVPVLLHFRPCSWILCEQ